MRAANLFKISLSDILKRHVYSSLRSAREIVKFFTKSGRVTNEAYHMAQILLKVGPTCDDAFDNPGAGAAGPNFWSVLLNFSPIC